MSLRAPLIQYWHQAFGADMPCESSCSSLSLSEQCLSPKDGLFAVQAFEKASGKKVAYKLAPRRGGDTEAVWAATETAEKELGWKTKLDIHDMCRDQWKWASTNPKGYEG